MKRFHVMLQVQDLRNSVDFYTQLFGSAPTLLEEDYAKWMLDDPRINFSLASRGQEPGVEHLGVQFDSVAELDKARDGFARERRHDEGQTSCCYANSEKSWLADPDDIHWELFHTRGQTQHYHGP